MNEKNNITNSFADMNTRRLLKALRKRVWLIALVALLCAAAALLGTIFLITPKYQSSVMFYVYNSTSSVGEGASNISSGDISASKSLVETYIVILESRTSLNEIIEYAELDYSMSEVKSMIDASSVNSTELFEVVVTGPDPEEAQIIANAIAHILPDRISEIVKGTSVQVVDYAVKPTQPSSPNRVKNTLIGFMIGAILTFGLIILRALFDNMIRTEEDIAQSSEHPVLATIPDMTAHSKGGYYYDRDNKKKGKQKQPATDPTAQNAILLGDGISFAASEAYKLLRTKIQFSFADNQLCRIIGVSSSFAGEGKSLSAVNLSYALAQLDKRILLIDCDMRRPSIASKLGVQKLPGLSNYLAGRIELEEIIQSSGPKFELAQFSVIAAGRNPPNPVELLGSDRMGEMLDSLQKDYDYIILDLPPVGEVSDAMVAAKFTDGMLLVVYQGHCSRGALMNTVKQFEFVNSKILGFAMNRASENAGTYGKKYDKKYYASRQ